MYFQLPTANSSKNNDVNYKILNETTTPCIFVKTTKHKIAMSARTVSGPAGCLCLRLENRTSKTLFFAANVFLLRHVWGGWGGGGWDDNIHCF